MKRLLALAWNNLGWIAAGVVAVYCIAHLADGPRLNWGDSGSDYNVMEAGRNFARYGFLTLRLTPYLFDPRLMTSADGSLIYTHYPQLPDLMNGLERVIGLSSLPAFRAISLAFALASLGFFFALVRRTWDAATAQIALALWVTNPLWIQHADYLHHIPYLMFFGWGALYFLDRYLAGDGRRFLALAGAFLFVTFFSSYDWWFFAPILAALMTWRRYRAIGPTFRVLAILGACALAAVLFKFGTNVWARGGLPGFIADLRFQFAERAGSSVTGINTRAAAWPTFIGRVDRYFSVLFFPIALFWLVQPVIRRRSKSVELAHRGPNPWWLALAAIPFLALFMEMWIGQAYPSLLVLPFVVVSAAALVTLLVRNSRFLVRALGVVLVVALIGNSVAEGAQLKRATLSNASMASLHADLDKVTAPGQFVLGNHIFDSFYRYYVERNLVGLNLVPPARMPSALRYYTNPRNTRIVGPYGAIFVQHKAIADQLYDKGIYYILAQAGAWDAWGNPPEYHQAINALVEQRDSVLMSLVAARGRKLKETGDYAIWSLPPASDSTPQQ